MRGLERFKRLRYRYKGAEYDDSISGRTRRPAAASISSMRPSVGKRLCDRGAAVHERRINPARKKRSLDVFKVRAARSGQSRHKPFINFRAHERNDARSIFVLEHAENSERKRAQTLGSPQVFCQHCCCLRIVSDIEDDFRIARNPLEARANSR